MTDQARQALIERARAHIDASVHYGMCVDCTQLIRDLLAALAEPAGYSDFLPPGIRAGIEAAAEQMKLAALADPAPSPARFTVLPPYLERQGRAPIETTHPCLYTQTRPCRELYPTEPDHWCGYCAGTHRAAPILPVPEPEKGGMFHCDSGHIHSRQSSADTCDEQARKTRFFNPAPERQP